MAYPTIADRKIELKGWIETGRAEALRTDAGLSRRDLAVSLDVSEVTVWRWEHAANHPGGRLPRGRNAVEYHRILARLARAERGRVA